MSQYSCMGFSKVSPCHQMGWDPQKVNVFCAFSLNRIYDACIFCIKDNADIYVAKLIGGFVPHKVLLICVWYYRRWHLVLLISQVIRRNTMWPPFVGLSESSKSHIGWIWAFTQPYKKWSPSYFLYWTNHKHICFSSISSLSMPMCELLYTHTHQNENTFGYFGFSFWKANTSFIQPWKPEITLSDCTSKWCWKWDTGKWCIVFSVVCCVLAVVCRN